MKEFDYTKKEIMVTTQEDLDGKVRTSELKVLREIPLEECGLLGEFLAKRKIK